MLKRIDIHTYKSKVVFCVEGYSDSPLAAARISNRMQVYNERSMQGRDVSSFLGFLMGWEKEVPSVYVAPPPLYVSSSL